MAHVRTRPDAFASVVSRTYAAALDGALWPDALTSASDYLGAIGGMLVRNEPLHRRGWMVVGRLRDDLTKLYLTRYVDNPYTRAILEQPAGRTLLVNSLVDAAAVRRTAFHADILRPQGIAEMVVLPYSPWHRGASTGGIAFALDARAAASSEAGLRRRHARLVPHLLRAMDLAAAAGANDAGRQSAQAMADAVPGAAMLLDGSGRLLHANPAAETLLRERDGLTAGGRTVDDARRLRAARTSDDRALGCMVLATATEAAGKDPPVRHGPNGWAASVRIARPSGRPDLIACAVPLPAGALPWADRDAPQVALFVLRPDLPGEQAALAPLLAAAFGLTPAEGRVAVLAGGGLGLPETARRLGISTETARTHLRRCFAKTGVQSQAGLARMVASLPAVGALPPFPGTVISRRS